MIQKGASIISNVIQYVAGQPKYEVPFPATPSVAAPLRGDQWYFKVNTLVKIMRCRHIII